MDRNYWEQACNASVNRPLPQLQQANRVANGIAVRLLALKGAASFTHHFLRFLFVLWLLRYDIGLTSHFPSECNRVFARLQAAALAAERQGSGGRPHMEEPAAVQRLDLRRLRSGYCSVLYVFARPPPRIRKLNPQYNSAAIL